MYVRLSEQCGLGDHLSVLNVMLSRIAKNMKTFVTSEEVVARTLELFQVKHNQTCRYPQITSKTHAKVLQVPKV